MFLSRNEYKSISFERMRKWGALYHTNDKNEKFWGEEVQRQAGRLAGLLRRCSKAIVVVGGGTPTSGQTSGMGGSYTPPSRTGC